MVFGRAVRQAVHDGHLRLPTDPIDRTVAALGVIGLSGLAVVFVVSPWLLPDRSVLLIARSEDIFGVEPEIRARLASFVVLGVALALGWALLLWGSTKLPGWLSAAGVVTFASFHIPLATLVDSGVTLAATAIAAAAVAAGRYGGGIWRGVAAIIVAAAAGLASISWTAAASVRLQHAVDESFADDLLRLLQVVGSLQLPLAIVGGLAIIDLHYRVSAVVVGALRRSAARLLPAAVIVVAVLKLASYAFLHREALLEWSELVPRVFSAATAFALAAVIVGWRSRNVRGTLEAETVRERLSYVAPLTLLVPIALQLMATALISLAEYLDWPRPSELPGGLLAGVLFMVLAAFVLAGIVVLVRNRGVPRRIHLGTAAVLTALWVPTLAVVPVGHDPTQALVHTRVVVDAAATVVVAGLVLFVGRRPQTITAAYLLAVLVFGWLLASNLQLLARLGAALAVPVAASVAVGVSYSLVADSHFANRDTPRLPASARALMWLGYITIASGMAAWAASAGLEQPGVSSVNQPAVSHLPLFLLVFQIPFAVWVAVSHGFESRAGRVAP